MGQKPGTILSIGEKMILEGFSRMLTQQLQVDLIYSCNSGFELLRKSLEKKPELIISAVRLMDLNGFSAARKILEYLPESKVIMISKRFNEAYLRQTMDEGFHAYISLEEAFDTFITVYRKVVSGQCCYVEKDGRLGIRKKDSLAGSGHPSPFITKREKEIALLLADGYTLKEAASFLFISVKTADNHRTSLMKKLRAKNVTDIVKYCIQNRLIDI